MIEEIKARMNSKRASQGPNHSRKFLNILGGLQKRNALGLSQDKLKLPGPADYESRPGLFERMRKKHSSDLRLPSSLNKSAIMAQSRTSLMSETSSKQDTSHLGPGCYQVDKSL